MACLGRSARCIVGICYCHLVSVVVFFATFLYSLQFSAHTAYQLSYHTCDEKTQPLGLTSEPISQTCLEGHTHIKIDGFGNISQNICVSASLSVVEKISLDIHAQGCATLRRVMRYSLGVTVVTASNAKKMCNTIETAALR